jgi:SAM-dependent methyltransferase
MSSKTDEAVRRCYAAWSATYHDEYYSDKAPYPPIHVDLVRQLLTAVKARRILDAGCGPASMLRHLVPHGFDPYGFDLTPEMVTEGKRAFADLGLGEERIWQGSITNADDFLYPADKKAGFDAIICWGALPHIPAEHDRLVVENMFSALKPCGLACLQARNELFALFTLNRYSCQFFAERLIPEELLKAKSWEKLRQELEARFRMDLPPLRSGGDAAPGYDEILSRQHNPFELREIFAAAGFVEITTHFQHFHALPPMFSSLMSEEFKAASLHLEKNSEDWRGHFMASTFVVTGRRP